MKDNRRGQPERLSSLQKYILTACYMKTILKRPLRFKLWKFEESRGLHSEEYSNIYFAALYESDIMLNYYGLYNWNNEDTYGYQGGSNAQKTALRRSLKTLLARGYINPYNQWSVHSKDKPEYYHISSAIITLTEKGKQTASKFLNVVDGSTMHEPQQ